MGKRIVSIFFLLLIVCSVSACNENYPYVTVDNSHEESDRVISIGKPYTYTGFDLENIDGGKDLILHFTENKDDE